jgi:hypothetical protein
VRPVSGEPWHLEPSSIQAMKAAIRSAAPTANAQSAPAGVSNASGPTAPSVNTAKAGAPIPVKEPTAAASPQAGATQDQKAAIKQVMDPPLPAAVQKSSNLAKAQQKFDEMPRLASVGRRVKKTVDVSDDDTDHSQGTGARKTSMNDISFYVGDFPFLTLNLGMTEG